MYESFYGFTARPFTLLPDEEFLYLGKQHRTALSLLEYGVMAQAGFVVVTGEVGAGKTTTIRRFIKSGHKNLTTGIVTNPTPGPTPVMSWVSTAFGLPHSGLDALTLYNNFVEFLLGQYAAGNRTMLLIDEAQHLNFEKLEELRMLSNVNNEKDQLLQIVLVGQPELLDLLRRPELRQFAQRIAVHYHLAPLNGPETTNYIQHRLSMVNGRPELFDPLSCAAVYYFTGGVPRLINLLCDLGLVFAFAEGHTTVSVETLLSVAKARSATGLSPFRITSEDFSLAQLMSELQPANTDLSESSAPAKTMETSA